MSVFEGKRKKRISLVGGYFNIYSKLRTEGIRKVKSGVKLNFQN